ncbi:MAG TPA: hypothetical protein EYG40_04385, partial [Verrucomicrobia bacterium]|nr:hypothetical protein [Verrucomicrobiota bacterium]
MMKYRTLILLFTLAPVFLIKSEAVEIANSINDFTTDGTQDSNGWVSGYRNYSQDGGGDDYNATDDFIAFDKDSHWRGDFWRIVPSNAPWTTVKAENGHPNGSNN